MQANQTQTLNQPAFKKAFPPGELLLMIFAPFWVHFRNCWASKSQVISCRGTTQTSLRSTNNHAMIKLTEIRFSPILMFDEH